MKKPAFSPVKQGQLPYLRRWWLFAITVVVNAGVICIFSWQRPFGMPDVITDTTICGITTSFITVPIIAEWIVRMRQAGTLPGEVPISTAIQRLPRQRWLLAALSAVVFGIATPLVFWLLMKVYQIDVFTFVQMLGLKIIYSLLLCQLISRFAVLRFIQPDCATPADAPIQRGSEKVANPMPRISYFSDRLNDIKAQAGFGLLMGLVFGSVSFTPDRLMVVAPTLRSGIAITGCITALLVSLFFLPPLHKQLWGLRMRGEIPISPVRNPWVAWLPENSVVFGLVLLLPMAVEMSVVFWVVLRFMGFDVLNYFQFLLIIVLHNTLLFKALVPLIIARATQPARTERTAVVPA
ncbi:hypothetical protein [Brooklawnia sp.]|uniref:hypothetical protein n=1 Tax=Brooklawnia sp. TaxID=2699740 RepID=UPI00311EEF51